MSTKFRFLLLNISLPNFQIPVYFLTLVLKVLFIILIEDLVLFLNSLTLKFKK